MAFKDVLMWRSWWVWGNKELSIFQHSAYKKTRTRPWDKALFDAAHSKMNQEARVSAVIRNLIVYSGCSTSVREKVINLGFATHLECCLTSPSQIRQLASEKCLKITALLKHMVGLSGSGTCALGCAGASVGSSGDQKGLLQVPSDVHM